MADSSVSLAMMPMHRYYSYIARYKEDDNIGDKSFDCAVYILKRICAHTQKITAHAAFDVKLSELYKMTCMCRVCPAIDLLFI